MESTEKMIEEIVASVVEPGKKNIRRSYYLKESLHALVRLAQVEQMTDMRQSVNLAAGLTISASDRRKGKAECKKLISMCQSKQNQLRFD